MKYSSPECAILLCDDIVLTSMEEIPTKPSHSGGIELPFIPG